MTVTLNFYRFPFDITKARLGLIMWAEHYLAPSVLALRY